MTAGQQSMAVLMVISAIPLAGLAIYATKRWDRPGSRGFLLCQIGAIGWSIQLALLAWPVQYLTVPHATAIRFVFQFLVVFGWPLLVIEYVRRERIRIRPFVGGLLLIVPIATVLLTVSEPLQHLVIDPATPANPVGIGEIVLGPWYLVFIAFSVGMIVYPSGVLLGELRTAEGVHRKQILLLLGGIAVGLPGSLHTYVLRVLDGVPAYVDLTPLAFLVAGVLWGIALFRYRLFGAAPVTRHTAVEVMSEPVIAIDDERTVIDANPSARELFEVQGSYAGLSLEAFCRSHPELLDAFETQTLRDVEVTLDDGVQSRHFLLTVDPVELLQTEQGSVLVLREVTELREREQQLDLFKQVLSRVFRHNLRTRLNVIQGYTQNIREGGDPTESTAKILASTERLVELSEKAADLEEVMNPDRTSRRTDLAGVVRTEVESFRDQWPEVTVTTTTAGDCAVYCHPLFERVIRELLSNAAIHFDGDHADLTIEVTLRREDRRVVLVVADNGRGIHEFETDALLAERETPLDHTSGVGLWMVYLIVRRSGGTTHVDGNTPHGGARVRIVLPAADSR